MAYLLDTHALLWFQEGNQALSKAALEILKDKEHECWVSYVSLFELSIKISLGKMRLPLPLPHFIQEKVIGGDFKLLQIEVFHLNRLVSLPWHHRDPFDRLLAAQAEVEHFTLISGDAIFSRYPVKVLW